jgi:hypothetical protein
MSQTSTAKALRTWAGAIVRTAAEETGREVAVEAAAGVPVAAVVEAAEAVADVEVAAAAAVMAVVATADTAAAEDTKLLHFFARIYAD